MKQLAALLVAVFTGFYSIGQSPLNALHFDGANDYVTAPLPTLFTNLATNDFTVEVWVNREAGGRIFFAQQDPSNFATVLLNLNLLFYVKVSNITYTSTVGMPPAGEWTHVACTWDASEQLPRVYFNGVLQTGTSGGASSSAINSTLSIGGRTDGFQPFMGAMDEFRIWNTTRTPCEIRSMMHSLPTGAEANLIHYYNFNRGVAGQDNAPFTTLPDQVGANPGTLNNFALADTTSNWVASGAPITANVTQPAFSTTASAVICPGESYTFGTQNLTESGTYEEVFTSVEGCDSLVTLTLAVNDIPADTQTVVTCGDYVWPVNGETYAVSGFYTETLTSVYGCDSVIVLDLAIGDPSYSEETASACESFTWAQTGETYLTSGLYTDTLTSIYGCDSILALNLTIGEPTFAPVQFVETCDSYVWEVDGQPYTVSGTYTDTLVNAAGCDSIVTLELVIHTMVFSIEQVQYCGPYTWPVNGQTYSISGNYDAFFQTVHGCDSILTLSLTTSAPPVAAIIQTDENTLLGTAPGAIVLEWLDCETGLPIPGQTGQSTFTPTEAGHYAVVVWEPLSSCSDTSDCYDFGMAGLSALSTPEVVISPNPANNQVRVAFPGTTADLIAYDAQGKQVLRQTIQNEEAVWLDHLEAGVYFFEVRTETGRVVARVVKE